MILLLQNLYTGGKWHWFALNKSLCLAWKTARSYMIQQPSCYNMLLANIHTENHPALNPSLDLEKLAEPWKMSWIPRDAAAAVQTHCLSLQKLHPLSLHQQWLQVFWTEQWPNPWQRFYGVSKILGAIPISKNSDSLGVMHCISFNMSIMFLRDN